MGCAVQAARRLRDALRRDGHDLVAVNLGGGLPSHHAQPTPPLASYGETIRDALRRHGLADLDVMTEPGRFLVGDAGLIRAEVVLATEKPSDGDRRWVYLDIGMFNGLIETQEEAIRYRISCPGAEGADVPSVLAGPTCDSLDILYERVPYPLPAAWVRATRSRSTLAGAYTTSYSSVGFNGIEPLRAYHLPTTHPEESAPNGELVTTYGRLDDVVMIGFGSIGRGTLPLILRHFDVDPDGSPCSPRMTTTTG